ncbi:hypothetical protein [Hydrogenophaga sp. RAC07]|uniref:hypothetical protein n=1 Tax=Hydrogenophaga sp. RAC07 TaxID=1842537 RepID=UPI00083D0364|nr:hypothetical protein [Hydrogenophaga sp. RAC07]
MGLHAFAFLVLTVAAGGFAVAFYALRSEADEMRGQHGALLGRSQLLEGLLDEVCASWMGMPGWGEPGAELLALGRNVANCLPKLLNKSGMRAGQYRLTRQRLTQEDFVSAGLAHDFSQINILLTRLDEPSISQLWDSRRMLDLMSILRFIQVRLSLSSPKTANMSAAPNHGNPLLSMLREEVDAVDICAEIQNQVQRLNASAHLVKENPQGEQALQAIVEALSFRRNGLGKPFTLAGLVLSLSGKGLEDLYRECRHDAETVNGSWRVQFNGLRSYVESLPGWDGRLPFADMMVATHNSYVADELSVLMRVA